MIRDTTGKSKLRTAVERFYWRVVWHVAWRISQISPRVHGKGPLLVAMGDSLTDPFVGFTFPWQVWVRYVGRKGYKTVNLGAGGETTGQMLQRVDEFFGEGRPDVAVLYAGSCDVEHFVDPVETEQNVTSIVQWLHAHGVERIALIAPGIVNLSEVPEWLAHIPNWASATEAVRAALKNVAARHDAVYVDLAGFHRGRMESGVDPDFSKVPYRQSRSWHASAGDAHLNAYGNRLVAEAFLTATAHWRPAPRRLGLPVVGRRRPRTDPTVP
jgi:lysophospholipase L1-like esterase